MTNQEIDHLVFMLRLQSISAPFIFLTRESLWQIIGALEHFLTKIDHGCSVECEFLIKKLKGQSAYAPKIELTAEDIQTITAYLIEYERLITEIGEFKPGYTPKSDELFGKCVLQVRFENEEEYKRWLEANQRYKWTFDHTYPAIMRAEYKFHTVYDVELMAKEIVNLLQMGFDVRSVDWKVKEFKSQL